MTMYLKRLATGLALSAAFALTACTSIEPMTGENQYPEKWGDKAWAYVHPWYNPTWSTGGKWAYWIGPGH